MTPAAAIQLGREVAEGLAAAHAAGIVHRDIKPGNIWLERRDAAGEPGAEATASFPGSGLAFRVRLLDFGLARVNNGEVITQTGTVLGTAAYMAPEQADGKDVDARADLFSLGAVLYQCLTGQRAFVGDSLVATLKAVSSHTPVPPFKLNAAVPRELSDLVMRLLAKDPAGRPATAREVGEQLARMAPVPEVAPPRPVRSRHWIGGAVAASVALVGGVWAAANLGSRADTANPAPPVRPVDGTPPVATTPKYDGTVDILVQRVDEDGSDRLFPLWDARAMPLRAGDSIRIEAKVEPAAYVYLFWIDEAGKAAPVYPWALGKWGTRPAGEQPATHVDVRSPSGKSPRISGDAEGTETILMVARPTPLPRSDEQIKQWFAGLKPLAFRGEKARAWFENFDLLRGDAKRGVTDDGGAGDGPVGLQATLRERIGAAAAYSRAISFSRLGPPKERK